MNENYISSPSLATLFLKKKKRGGGIPNNAKVIHSENAKRPAVVAPNSHLLQRVGARLWPWPQHCRNPLSVIFLPALPSRPALACLFCFSLLFPCHFVQYSGFKHARILSGLLASPQEHLVFCSVMQQTHRFTVSPIIILLFHVFLDYFTALVCPKLTYQGLAKFACSGGVHHFLCSFPLLHQRL